MSELTFSKKLYILFYSGIDSPERCDSFRRMIRGQYDGIDLLDGEMLIYTALTPKQVKGNIMDTDYKFVEIDISPVIDSKGIISDHDISKWLDDRGIDYGQL